MSPCSFNSSVTHLVHLFVMHLCLFNSFITHIPVHFFNVYTHAELLQSCPTLSNPVDCSLPGSSVHGDSPGKNTGVDFQAHLQGIFLTQRKNLLLLHLLH